MRRSAALLEALLAALALGLLPSRAAQPDRPIRLAFETAENAIYPRQDLVLRLTFTSGKDATTTIEAAAFARETFAVRDARGNPPRKVSRSGSDKGADEPLVIKGYDKAERLVNLSGWYPGLTGKRGTWEVSWSHGEWKAGPIRVAITKPYDPEKDRTAVVETDLGTMRWALLPEHAPQHVKRFVDLARQGFYDGLTIFRVIPGLQAEGGDPKGDGTGAWQKLMMPEISPALEMGTGLVGAARQETSMTSDSIFFITLGPSEFMKGKHTFYARLTDGWDVIARLHPIPTKGDTGLSDSFLLLSPVKIRRVKIE